MPNHADAWKTAKNTFEAATGGKKPKQTKKGLFAKARAKKSGVAATLKDVDDLIPASFLDPVSDKTMAAINKKVAAAKKAGLGYIATVQGAIDKEKDDIGGKDASTVYRDLKILRNSLDAILANVTKEQAKLDAARAATRKEIAGGVKVTYMTLKTLAQGIDANCKEGLTWAQKVLKDPTPKNYNAGILTISRNIMQNFTQIVKFTVPEEASALAQKSALKALADPKIAQAVVTLDKQVTMIKAQCVPISKQTGGSPYDSSLGKMGNNPVELPDDASADDVKRAVKHFVGQVKAAHALRRGIAA